MDVRLEQSWKDALAGEFGKPYFAELADFVKKEYLSTKVYPPPKLIFSALDHCPFDKVKVVILGQDPYHGAGQAHGLSFSVPEGVRVPPSLDNIYKELLADIGTTSVAAPRSGNLECWADQGVLLLNATLTVRAGQAGSHQNKGWEMFTDAIIKTISEKRDGVVFILWGNYARNKKALIDPSKHLVIESPHPSPFSANNGFFGSRPFSKANAYLERNGLSPVDWLGERKER
jgi:uracil-DNA glycosylase